MAGRGATLAMPLAMTSASITRESMAVVPEALPIVYVVDDDISVRQALEFLIIDAGCQPQVFECAREFLAQPRVALPSCLILDIGLPDLNGLELQQRIAVERPELPIIFITGFGSVPVTVQAMKAGAVEFLTKPFMVDVLLSAIQNALQRSQAVLAQEAQGRALHTRHASLSRREREVMALVISGLLNKQVAAELGISEITVKAHRGSVMRKMKASSLADLVKMAARLGVSTEPRVSAAPYVAPALQLRGRPAPSAVQIPT
jgi:FixJ family two-component response regulator